MRQRDVACTTHPNGTRVVGEKVPRAGVVRLVVVIAGIFASMAMGGFVSPVSAAEWSWRGEVAAEIPDGWTATERGFLNPPPSHVLLLHSEKGDVLVVASVDGQRVAEGLAAHKLEVLLRTYLSSFHDARHTSLTTTEPWACELGGEVEETAGVVQHVELPNAELRTIYACGARDQERGLFVVVIGWRDGHDAPQPPADLLDAMIAVTIEEGHGEPSRMP